MGRFQFPLLLLHAHPNEMLHLGEDCAGGGGSGHTHTLGSLNLEGIYCGRHSLDVCNDTMR